jgi:hypothetical protein
MGVVTISSKTKIGSQQTMTPNKMAVAQDSSLPTKKPKNNKL